VLDAIRRAGPDAASRRKVIEQTLGLARRPLARFARFRVVGGRLVGVGRPL
jgi:hypothetical protein